VLHAELSAAMASGAAQWRSHSAVPNVGAVVTAELHRALADAARRHARRSSYTEVFLVIRVMMDVTHTEGFTNASQRRALHGGIYLSLMGYVTFASGGVTTEGRVTAARWLLGGIPLIYQIKMDVSRKRRVALQIGVTAACCTVQSAGSLVRAASLVLALRHALVRRSWVSRDARSLALAEYDSPTTVTLTLAALSTLDTARADSGDDGGGSGGDGYDDNDEYYSHRGGAAATGSGGGGGGTLYLESVLDLTRAWRFEVSSNDVSHKERDSEQRRVTNCNGVALRGRRRGVRGGRGRVWSGGRGAARADRDGRALRRAAPPG
jgi:hypothetical protein